MNIMLASVTERTHEIGILRSVGARRRDIVAQFIVEAGVMSAIGGMVGVALAGVVAWLVNMIFTAAVPVSAIVVGVALSAAVGLFFGIYPARKAARLDPVEALRMET
jgi:putative ABC transport system permease protein